MTDDTEVEHLRARVAELEAQLATQDGPRAAAPRRGRTSAWWGVASAVTLILACVLAPLSVTSVWASQQLSDTNAYVDTVAPLAHDPAVQTAVANKVTTVIFDNLNVQAFATEALNSIASQPRVPPRVAALLPTLAGPISNGVQSFTRDQVQSFTRSPQFVTLWDQVNRAAHTQVQKLLSGQQGGAVSAQGDTITLNLGPIVAAVKQRLVASGFSLAQNIPTVNQSFTLVQSTAVTRAQGFYRFVNTLGIWLPFVVLALLVAGVLLARDRRRALLKGALGLTFSMLVLGAGLAVARSWYVGATPLNVLTDQAAGSVFDTLVRFLRTGLRAVAVLGLVVALGAFLAGPSTAAVRTRRTVERGIGSARGSAEGAGWDTGRFGAWVFAHRRALQVAVLIAAGLAVVFWSKPTGWVVVGVAIAALVLLAIVEFLGTPPRAAAETLVPATGGEGPTLPHQRPASAEEHAPAVPVGGSSAAHDAAGPDEAHSGGVTDPADPRSDS